MKPHTLIRRNFMKSASLATASLAATGCARTSQIASAKRPTMIPRPDMLPGTDNSASAVFQLMDDDVACAHIYMEAQVFTPDSQRLILRRAAFSHGGDRYSPEHRFVLCDLENGGEIAPLATEPGATGPSISPDGKTLYYFVEERGDEGNRVLLKKVNLDGTGRDIIHVLDRPLPGTVACPSVLYPLSTISSDGKRIAISGFLGDGQIENPPFGMLVYDIEKATVELVWQGMTWANLHAQYSRSLDPEASHDVLIQQNHGMEYDRDGTYRKLVGGDGADIHVIRDDGTNLRTMPCGRDRKREMCQGHQCWRGRGDSAVIGTVVPGRDGKRGTLELVETRAVENRDHLGMNAPGAWRNNLSRNFPNPQFSHFGVDIAGERLLSDAVVEGRWLLYAAQWGRGKDDPLQDWKFVLDSGSSSKTHPHPFLSPDGKLGFFNSDESGRILPYMVTGIWDA